MNLERVYFWHADNFFRTIVFGRCIGDKLGYIERYQSNFFFYLHAVYGPTSTEEFYKFDLIESARLYNTMDVDLATGVKNDIIMAIDTMLTKFGLYVDYHDITNINNMKLQPPTTYLWTDLQG